MTKKKLKYGGASLLVTVLFLTAVILLNIFAGMLTDRFFLKADLTDTRLYTLSDRAAELLRGISETVDVIVLSEESSWIANPNLTRAADILSNYSAASGGSIRVQYVNPDLNTFSGPDYNNSLSELKDAHPELDGMERNDIILLSSRRASRVPATDLFMYGRNPAGRQVVTGVRADQALVSALLYVLNEQLARVVFIEGHQESPSETLMSIFDRSGYISSTVDLMRDDIPDDTVILISAAPKIDFLDEEILKLEQYLSLGGNAIIFYDFGTPSLPRLDTLLAQWGVTVENKIIFDEQFTFVREINVIGGRVVSGMLPSTDDGELFTMGGIPVGIPLPRPLRTDWIGGQMGSFRIFPLIETFSSSSYAKDRNREITTFERESGDESGPFVLAYHVRHLTADAQNNQVHANLIVAGAEMVEDVFLALYGQRFYNLPLISGIANDLNPYGESVFIPSKALQDSHMLVSSAGTRTVLVLMVIALPLTIILIGILVYRKRRHQ